MNTHDMSDKLDHNGVYYNALSWPRRVWLKSGWVDYQATGVPFCCGQALLAIPVFHPLAETKVVRKKLYKEFNDFIYLCMNEEYPWLDGYTTHLSSVHYTLLLYTEDLSQLTIKEARRYEWINASKRIWKKVGKRYINPNTYNQLETYVMYNEEWEDECQSHDKYKQWLTEEYCSYV